MKTLTNNEIEKLIEELKAIEENFEGLEILKNNRTYFVFQNRNKDDNNWIFSTTNINELKGWLYGTVQAKNKIIK